MAEYWNGAVDGDWQDNGNWSGVIPIANDEVIFDGRSTVAVIDGMAVDETGGVDFDLLHFKRSFTANVGLPAERLHTSAQRIIIEGSGTYYIEVSFSAVGADQVIPLIIINNANATVYLTSNQNTADWCCEFTEVIILAGTVHIGDTNIDTAIRTLRIQPNRSRNATVTIYEDCIQAKLRTIAFTDGTTQAIVGETLTSLIGGETAVVVDVLVTSGDWGTNDAAGILYLDTLSGVFQTGEVQNAATDDVCDIVGDTLPTWIDIYMSKGTCTCDSAINLLEMIDGSFTYGTDLEASPETDMNITTLRLVNGAFTWQPDDSDSDAYIGDVWLYGGTLNASGTTNNDRAKVLGNGAGNDIHIFAGATLNIANNLGNITIAGGSQLWNFGGTLITDHGAQIAVTYDQP